MLRRSPALIVGIATLAYLAAVTQRSSLGVAGVVAGERFHASAAELSSLAVAQLAIYAGLQIPVGMLLDRIGPTRLILGGAILMAAGQAIVAFAPGLGIAVLGRVLVGAGDATTYVSGLRLIASWLPPRRVPLVSQWYASIGQLGQVLSAIPFAALLHQAGWASAFCSLAGAAVLVSIAAGIALGDAPDARRGGHAVPVRQVLANSLAAVRRPGTQLGFWSHLSLQFSGTALSLLWGYPAMVEGLGYSPELASGLLPILMVAGLVTAPLVGLFAARFPVRRSTLVLGLAGANALVWALFLLAPGPPGLPVVVGVLAVTGGVTIASNIGFDFARTFNPHHSYGSASGIVNVGGFTASFVAMFAIGALLDLARGAGVGGWDAYRIAFATIPALTAIGMAGVLAARSRTRSRLAEDDGLVVAPLWRVLARRWRTRPAGGEPPADGGVQ